MIFVTYFIINFYSRYWTRDILLRRSLVDSATSPYSTTSGCLELLQFLGTSGCGFDLLLFSYGRSLAAACGLYVGFLGDTEHSCTFLGPKEKKAES